MANVGLFLPKIFWLRKNYFLFCFNIMFDRTFAGDFSSNKIFEREFWRESVIILALLIGAIGLYTLNLGELPLRDWDEATVAQVALEISQKDSNSLPWFFPSLWEEPYFNKPPLIHGLIAILFSITGVNEFSARIPGAILTAISVPLLYVMGREIFKHRSKALFSSLIYLTLLPVVRHGRLAMLDGGVICFSILMFYCTLRARRDLRFALGAGISFGLICLTKGMLGLLMAAIALLFLAWDTPRLLTSGYLWGGFFLGSLPVLGWYLALWVEYGKDFFDVGIISQSLARIYKPVESNGGSIFYYLWEILKYSCPWLIFSLYGFKLAFENIHWSWAKFILVWSGVYLLVVSLMATKLPWYILPIYPALALAGGASLGEVTSSWQNTRPYPFVWSMFIGLLAVGTTIACIYFSFIQKEEIQLVFIFVMTALTMVATTVLLYSKDSQFIWVLFWGMYICLLLFCSSDYWNWELNEAYPVKPVASYIKEQMKEIPRDVIVYTNFPYTRPSLSFYSQRQIISISQYQISSESSNQSSISAKIEQYWKTSQPDHFLLLQKEKNSDETIEKLNLESVKFLEPMSPNFEDNSWQLITKNTD